MPSIQEQQIAELAVEMGILNPTLKDRVLAYLKSQPSPPPLIQYLANSGHFSPDKIKQLRDEWVRRNGAKGSGAHAMPSILESSNLSNLAASNLNMGNGSGNALHPAAIKVDELIAYLLKNYNLVPVEKLIEARKVALEKSVRLGAVLVSRNDLPRDRLTTAVQHVFKTFAVCDSCGQTHNMNQGPAGQCPSCGSSTWFSDTSEAMLADLAKLGSNPAMPVPSHPAAPTSPPQMAPPQMAPPQMAPPQMAPPQMPSPHMAPPPSPAGGPPPMMPGGPTGPGSQMPNPQAVGAANPGGMPAGHPGGAMGPMGGPAGMPGPGGMRPGMGVGAAPGQPKMPSALSGEYDPNDPFSMPVGYDQSGGNANFQGLLATSSVNRKRNTSKRFQPPKMPTPPSSSGDSDSDDEVLNLGLSTDELAIFGGQSSDEFPIQAAAISTPDAAASGEASAELTAPAPEAAPAAPLGDAAGYAAATTTKTKPKPKATTKPAAKKKGCMGKSAALLFMIVGSFYMAWSVLV